MFARAAASAEPADARRGRRPRRAASTSAARSASRFSARRWPPAPRSRWPGRSASSASSCRTWCGCSSAPIIGSCCPPRLLFGAAFLVICDLIARTVMAPIELPVGIVTAMIGGPFFLWLLGEEGDERRSAPTMARPTVERSCDGRLAAALLAASLVVPSLASLTPRRASRPRRIVSLVPALTEMVFAIGAGDRVVAVSRYDEDPPQVRNAAARRRAARSGCRAHHRAARRIWCCSTAARPI